MEPNGVPDYQLHDVTSILSIRYEKTTQFAELSLSAERTRLLATGQNRITRTPGEIVLACEEILNEFATQTWPTNGMDEIKFPVLWRQRLAKAAIRITSIEELRKELSPLCVLKFSTLNKWADLLVAKLAKSVQAANENDNSLACHIPPGVCNSDGGNNLICPEAGNSDGGSNLIRPEAGNSNSGSNLTFR